MTNLQFSFNISAAEAFLEDISRNQNSYFLMISRPQAWPIEETPPSVVDSVSDQIGVWRDAIAAKRIDVTDIRLVTDRHDWTSGTVYSQFSDVDEMFRSATYESNPFYILTSESKVYKCLDNNGGAESTVEPTHTYSDLQTAGDDGYVWQFMYQLSEDDFDFVTENYIPVSLAGSTTKIGTIEYLQREVQENAKAGGIFNIRVTQTGSYWSDARILKSGLLEETFFTTHRVSNINNNAQYYSVLEDNTYDVAEFSVTGMNKFSRDVYKNWALTDLDMGTSVALPGTEFTQINFYKKILGNSGDRIYTTRFDVDPSSTTGFYNIVPYVYVTNGIGSTLESDVVAYPVFDNLGATTEPGILVDDELFIQDSKVITRVRVLDPSSNVYQPSVKVSPEPNGVGQGAGFSAEAFASPLGGHGSNAIQELGANKVMVRVFLKGSEGGAFDIQNDFRQFSLLRNPQNSGWTSGIQQGSVAGVKTSNYSVLDLRNDNNTATIRFANLSSHDENAFSIGQKVHQGEYSLNQARGTVLEWNYGVAGVLTVSVDNGKFRASVDPDEVPDTVSSGRIFYGLTTGTGYTGGGDGTDYGGFINTVTHSKSFTNLSYPVGSVVYGMNSGSTGKVVSWRSDSDGERGTLVLDNIVGGFEEPRVSVGEQLDGEQVFGFKSLNPSGEVSLSPSPVGTITKITKVPAMEDETHRLTTKVTGFFTDSDFQIKQEYLDQNISTTTFNFSGSIVGLNYTEGVTSGPNGSTVDFYLTNTNGSLTAGDVLSFNGYTAEYISTIDSEFLPYTGQVLYIENVRPVQRNTDQDEEIKLIVEF